MLHTYALFRTIATFSRAAIFSTKCSVRKRVKECYDIIYIPHRSTLWTLSVLRQHVESGLLCLIGHDKCGPMAWAAQILYSSPEWMQQGRTWGQSFYIFDVFCVRKASETILDACTKSWHVTRQRWHQESYTGCVSKNLMLNKNAHWTKLIFGKWSSLLIFQWQLSLDQNKVKKGNILKWIIF